MARLAQNRPAPASRGLAPHVSHKQNLDGLTLACLLISEKCYRLRRGLSCHYGDILRALLVVEIFF